MDIILKKFLVSLLLACSPVIATAQTKLLPSVLSPDYLEAQQQKLAADDAQQPLSSESELLFVLNVVKTTKAQHGINGVILKYALVEPKAFAQAWAEKEENSENPHQYYGYTYDHETEFPGKFGIAFYAQEGDQYILQFANDDALSKSLGQQSADNTVTTNQDHEIVVNIIWMNHIAGPTYTEYYFAYDDVKKDWRLNRYIDLKSDIHYPFYQYKGCAFNEGILLSQFSMDTYVPSASATDANALCLTHATNDGDPDPTGSDEGDGGFTVFYQQIETIKKQGKGPLLQKLLKGSDLTQFIFAHHYYSGEPTFYVGYNIEGINNLAYLLEQMDCLDVAQSLLEGVVTDVPERTVAYINLGDVYRKQGKTEQAKQAYTTYSDLMKKEGKETRIPKRVTQYLAQ